jgi:hypothetical protein
VRNRSKTLRNNPLEGLLTSLLLLLLFFSCIVFWILFKISQTGIYLGHNFCKLRCVSEIDLGIHRQSGQGTPQSVVIMQCITLLARCRWLIWMTCRWNYVCDGRTWCWPSARIIVSPNLYNSKKTCCHSRLSVWTVGPAGRNRAECLEKLLVSGAYTSQTPDFFSRLGSLLVSAQ